MRTIQSEIGKLDSVILRSAEAAFVNQAKIDSEWQKLYYLDKPDYQKSLSEYHQFKSIFEQHQIRVIEANSVDKLTIDSLYVRDSSFVCDSGAVLCRMGKTERIPESDAIKTVYQSLGIPILGTIEAPGKLEGGDLFWLDNRTIAIGQGYRTNASGIDQLRDFTKNTIDEIIVVPSPHWNGPNDVFHLMSVVSPLDSDLFLVYSRLLSVPFRELLLERGIELVEVADDEYDSMACNVLTIAPRVCIMLSGNLKTKKRMEAAGVTVHVYEGSEISLKGCGGPTCLTKPLWRSI